MGENLHHENPVDNEGVLEDPIHGGPISKARETEILRGLPRTTIVCRTPDGLPITKEGLLVAAVLRRNEETNRQAREIETEV